MKDLDRMAMAAMQGYISSLTGPEADILNATLFSVAQENNCKNSLEALAILSYDQAEAMLRESKKRSKDEPIEMD